MEHVGLGAIPTSKTWNHVVERMGGFGAALGLAGDDNAVVVQVLSTAERCLEVAIDGPDLRQSFHLLTKVLFVPHSEDWVAAFIDLGIRLAAGQTCAT
jgi:hypothetical protein